MTDLNDSHRLHKQIKAAAALKDALQEQAGGDEDVLRDMIEGETSLHEMIDKVVLSMDEDRIQSIGLTARIAELTERKDRVENRIEAKRAMIEQAMVIGEIQRLEIAGFTLSLRKVPAKVIIEDESKIPSAFWKAQDPRLDKKAVLDGLKDGKPVEGAQLSNGGIALQLRVK